MPKLQRTATGIMAVAVGLHEIERILRSTTNEKAGPSWDGAGDTGRALTMQRVEAASQGIGKPLTIALVNEMLDERPYVPPQPKVAAPAAAAAPVIAEEDVPPPVTAQDVAGEIAGIEEPVEKFTRSPSSIDVMD